MMSGSTPRSIEPSAVLLHMSEAGEPGIYVLGCYEGRITIASQQARAFNLAWALVKTGALEDGKRVAVVGGGVAGMSVAAGIAGCGASVVLFERHPQLLHLLHGGHTRFLHPNIYDWPKSGWGKPDTSFPYLNWECGTADQVAKKLLQQWDELARDFQIEVVKPVEVFLGGWSARRRQLTISRSRYHGGGTPADTSSLRKWCNTSHEFDTVILAVGFGREKVMPSQPERSYWRDDALHQPELNGTGERTSYLVSGNGDGGLIDLLRLRLREFRHEDLAAELEASAGTDDLPALVEELTRIEDLALAERSRNGDPDPIVNSSYKRLVSNEMSEAVRRAVDKVDEALCAKLRSDTTVTFNFVRSPLAVDSSILNRFVVSRLLDRDEHLAVVPGRVHSVVGAEPALRVDFEQEGGALQRTFNRVVLRHGAASAMEAHYPGIHGRVSPAIRARNTLDASRLRAWKESDFKPCPSASAISTSTDTGPAPTPLAQATAEAGAVQTGITQSSGDTRPGSGVPEAPGLSSSPTAARDSAFEDQVQGHGPRKISDEARTLFKRIMTNENVPGLQSKLLVLTEDDQASILLALARHAREVESSLPRLNAVFKALPSLSLPELNKEIDALVRHGSFSPSLDTKVKLLRVTPALLARATAPTLALFFDEILELGDSSVFQIANTVVPALVEAQTAIPAELRGRYVRGLLRQAESDARLARPAAQRTLRDLPPEIAADFFTSSDKTTILLRWSTLKELVQGPWSKWSEADRKYFQDVADLSYDDFRMKYAPGSGEDF